NVESDFNKILGKIEAVRGGKPYNLQSVINDSILRYTAKGDKFTLHVPRKETIPSKVEKSNDFISIDMGIRSPLTCLPSTEPQINFGEDLQKEIRNNLIWLETLKEKGYNKKFRRKWKKKLKAKIHNKVTDFHWQTCNVLTKCVDKIVVGDLNVKSIISKENDTITDLDKKVLIKLRLRGFIQKLKYKCVSRNCSLTLVNEAYTSKVCSNCGNYKADLGGNKTYNCDNIDCGQVIDRDVNACINILYKSSIGKYCRDFQN
ncbi:MAG TPA: RNA-guided endonuclease TnpB family protein, partial [Candidatus Babeliaceae bacterium]|nr:RNA-guided endonuclease TnpB family protein [Candidatus Babeliaceae bacterium]